MEADTIKQANKKKKNKKNVRQKNEKLSRNQAM